MTVYEKVLVLVLERQNVVAIKQVLRKRMTFLAMTMNFLIGQRRNHLVRNPMSNNQLTLLIVFLRKRIPSQMTLKVKRNCSKKRSIICLRVMLQILGMTLMLT
uniref:Uncharacterized protein n=1 Tax=Arundo donax TaxID=35708 RepID=A0A0A9EX41_ARUDO